MRRLALLALPLVAGLLVAGCVGGSADDNPAPAASSGRPSAAPTPTFADVTRGDTESVVKLIVYDGEARSAVVEPVVFMQAPDFCAAFRLPDTDPRCEREWATEDSHLKATLPVSAKAKLATVRDGDPACIGADTGAGTCAMTKSEFKGWLPDHPESLFRLTTRDGTVVELAEMYLP